MTFLAMETLLLVLLVTMEALLHGSRGLCNNLTIWKYFSLYSAHIFFGSKAITGMPGSIETELHKVMKDLCNNWTT